MEFSTEFSGFTLIRSQRPEDGGGSESQKRGESGSLVRKKKNKTDFSVLFLSYKTNKAWDGWILLQQVAFLCDDAGERERDMSP